MSWHGFFETRCKPCRFCRLHSDKIGGSSEPMTPSSSWTSVHRVFRSTHIWSTVHCDVLRNWFETWRSKHLKWYYSPHPVPEAWDLGFLHQNVADSSTFLFCPACKTWPSSTCVGCFVFPSPHHPRQTRDTCQRLDGIWWSLEFAVLWIFRSSFHKKDTEKVLSKLRLWCLCARLVKILNLDEFGAGYRTFGNQRSIWYDIIYIYIYICIDIYT